VISLWLDFVSWTGSRDVDLVVRQESNKLYNIGFVVFLRARWPLELIASYTWQRGGFGEKIYGESASVAPEPHRDMSVIIISYFVLMMCVATKGS
jgi:hypothetical protein